jgi:hypothetical protein
LPPGWLAGQSLVPRLGQACSFRVLWRGAPTGLSTPVFATYAHTGSVGQGIQSGLIGGAVGGIAGAAGGAAGGRVLGALGNNFLGYTASGFAGGVVGGGVGGGIGGYLQTGTLAGTVQGAGMGALQGGILGGLTGAGLGAVRFSAGGVPNEEIPGSAFQDIDADVAALEAELGPESKLPEIEGQLDSNRSSEHNWGQQITATVFQALSGTRRVAMGRSLSSFSGLEHSPDIQPDAMRLTFGGKVDAVEIVSKYQTVRQMQTKLATAWQQLPPEMRGQMSVFNSESPTFRTQLQDWAGQLIRDEGLQ